MVGVVLFVLCFFLLGSVVVAPLLFADHILSQLFIKGTLILIGFLGHMYAIFAFDSGYVLWLSLI